MLTEKWKVHTFWSCSIPLYIINNSWLIHSLWKTFRSLHSWVYCGIIRVESLLLSLRVPPTDANMPITYRLSPRFPPVWPGNKSESITIKERLDVTLRHSGPDWEVLKDGRHPTHLIVFILYRSRYRQVEIHIEPSRPTYSDPRTPTPHMRIW